MYSHVIGRRRLGGTLRITGYTSRAEYRADRARALLLAALTEAEAALRSHRVVGQAEALRRLAALCATL